MAEKTRQAAKKDGFTAEERAAMQERARELRAAKADGEADLLAKMAEMPAADRHLAERLHALVTVAAPGLKPKTWYGMPAWAAAGKDGKIVCFFQSAAKFKARYATLGFSDTARLDDGAMWPTSYALTEWNAAVESQIRELLKRAVG